MSATRGVIREKKRVAHDLIKSHLMTPELSAELFAQKGIGAFRFSTALIRHLQRLSHEIGESLRNAVVLTYLLFSLMCSQSLRFFIYDFIPSHGPTSNSFSCFSRCKSPPSCRTQALHNAELLGALPRDHSR